MKLISVRRIWEQAAHNAFTDLIAFQEALFCVFREGTAHVSPDGALRILRSVDGGETWQSVALIRSDEADLRDGKLIEYQGELLLLGGGTLHNKSGIQSHLWRSADGRLWSDALKVADKGYWLWRLTEHQNTLYGVGYRPGPDGDTRLYKSDDGVQFMTWLKVFNNQGYVNETAIVFDQDSGFCLLRRDPVWGPEFVGLLGYSRAPFTDWQWQALDKRIGGPVMLMYQSRLLAVVRLYDEQVRTALVEIHPDTGLVQELLTLPSKGDTSYAGVVIDGNELWVSYYSSHELADTQLDTQNLLDESNRDAKSKAMIYFAKIQLS
ncbi:exo-alpha-sialidase [Shewanella baltica]|uniref:exo-alpha-sialidase n=1 Tax=Shewanella baltica TaxID=62322 RepID=UPI0028712C4B|nr:exo-alpha-sialidase [Shewanella baltica]MDR9767997.1 exo-alpha-sialidase [Shewanella baltica]